MSEKRGRVQRAVLRALRDRPELSFGELVSLLGRPERQVRAVVDALRADGRLPADVLNGGAPRPRPRRAPPPSPPFDLVEFLKAQRCCLQDDGRDGWVAHRISPHGGWRCDRCGRKILASEELWLASERRAGFLSPTRTAVEGLRKRGVTVEVGEPQRLCRPCADARAQLHLPPWERPGYVAPKDEP